MTGMIDLLCVVANIGLAIFLSLHCFGEERLPDFKDEGVITEMNIFLKK